MDIVEFQISHVKCTQALPKIIFCFCYVCWLVLCFRRKMARIDTLQVHDHS